MHWDTEISIIRDKAYTYTKQALEEIRVCGQFVFWRDPKRLRGYTSQYFKILRKKNSSKNGAEDAPAYVLKQPTESLPLLWWNWIIIHEKWPQSRHRKGSKTAGRLKNAREAPNLAQGRWIPSPRCLNIPMNPRILYHKIKMRWQRWDCKERQSRAEAWGAEDNDRNPGQ